MRCLHELLAVMLLAGCASGAAAPATQADSLAGLDRRVAAEVERAGLPGATFAVLWRDGSAHRQAFGVADLDSGQPLRANARMRIASVSKPFTAVAVLRLAEQGGLDLDAPAVPRIARRLPEDFAADPGFARLTARQLLAHCGGWGGTRDLDPMLQSRYMAGVLGTPEPPAATRIVAWALARPPDFAPGTRCGYSNLGYAALGRLIESETGFDYAEAVRRLVLAPAGIEGMRLASSLPAHRLPDEPRYHDARRAPSAFEPGVEVPLPDGAFAIEAMDAHGGWLATAEDLVRLVAALEGRDGPALLSPAGRRGMLAPVERGVRHGAHYALGWEVDRGGRRYWHQGDLPGTAALLVREADGAVWSLIANGAVDDPRAHDRLRRRIGAAVRGGHPR